MKASYSDKQMQLLAFIS